MFALNQKPEWIGKAHPLGFDFFTISTVFNIYQDELVGLTGTPFNYKYEDQIIYYDQHNIDHHVDFLLNQPTEIEKQIAFIKLQIDALSKAGEDYGSKDNFDSFTQWYFVYRQFLLVLGIVFGLETALEKLLKGFLPESDFHSIAFAKETPIVLEQKSLLELGVYFEEPAELDKQIDTHLERYAWLGNNFLNYSPYTKQEILKRLNAAREDYERQLNRILEERERLEKAAQSVLKQINSEQRKLIRLYQDLLFLRTARANAVARSATLTHPLFSSVAKKIGFTREEILRLSFKEIEAMHAGKQKFDVVEREEYYAVILDGKLDVVWGSWGKRAEKVDGVTEIVGNVASRGIARGKVRIVHNLSDLSKVERGDVLVAPYTNPNMVPAMERASAFVTDIGGLTSHAAIVSREMGKPCIIGTKIATQVLKDGDRVEVDAEKGLVRVL